ncbi:hypothetical protein NPIL_136751 [Nephila pilipes]|uniref:Uncharacterized protein n=1 Tax=Nephila pilipes TaxID=299642 RepID=A0A8X6P0F1_NEPPI|nr:hypothetical protein NPIL_136751 [Nephila pilipes]
MPTLFILSPSRRLGWCTGLCIVNASNEKSVSGKFVSDLETRHANSSWFTRTQQLYSMVPSHQAASFFRRQGPQITCPSPPSSPPAIITSHDDKISSSTSSNLLKTSLLLLSTKSR